MEDTPFDKLAPQAIHAIALSFFFPVGARRHAVSSPCGAERAPARQAGRPGRDRTGEADRGDERRFERREETG